MAQRFHTVRYLNGVTGESERLSFYSYGGGTSAGWGMVASDPSIRPAENGVAATYADADEQAARLADAFGHVCGGVVTHDEPPTEAVGSFGAYRPTIADLA